MLWTATRARLMHDASGLGQQIERQAANDRATARTRVIEHLHRAQERARAHHQRLRNRCVASPALAYLPASVVHSYSTAKLCPSPIGLLPLTYSPPVTPLF